MPPLPPRWSLEGHRALITGSTKGIGLACAREFLSLGGTVFITARNAEEVAGTVATLRGEYSEAQVEGFPSDICTSEGRTALLAAVEAAWGGALDCLVNNAGTNVRKPMLEATDDEYDSIVRVNMDAVWYLCKAAHRLLVKSTSPVVVNVSSVAGVNSTGSGGVYGMTKAAVVQLTKTMACEWAKYSIRVNCIAPWVTMTPLLAEAVKNNPAALDKAAAWTPMGRPAQPEEIAAGVAFMALPCASFVTGQTLCVDGGLMAGAFAGPCTD